MRMKELIAAKINELKIITNKLKRKTLEASKQSDLHFRIGTENSFIHIELDIKKEKKSLKEEATQK